jgi:hypothetical protein
LEGDSLGEAGARSLWTTTRQPTQTLRVPGNAEATHAPIHGEFKEDHFGELAPVLTQSEILFTRDMLPADYRFTEKPRTHEYLNEFDPITRRYVASDAPLKTEPKHPERKLCLNGFSNVITFVGDDGIEAHYGEGLTGSWDASPWVRVDTQLHSQHPSIKIQIKDPERKEPTVTCHIFPGCIKRNEHGCCDLAIQMNRDTSTGKAVDHPELKDRRINNSLMEIKMKLWEGETVAKQPSAEYVSQGQTPARPSFTGIGLAELHQICEECHSLDPRKMTLRRQLIGLLATQTEISVFRAWPIGGERAFETFRSWLLCAFQACALHGYEWFYAMQMQTQMPLALAFTDNNFRELKEPRWLTTVFKTTFSRQSTFLQLETYKVAPFIPATAVKAKTAVMLPTPEVGAFELCAAINRNHQRQSVLLSRFFHGMAFKIEAVLSTHPTAEGKFFASLHVPADIASANKNCKLESFTHIRVLLRLANHQAVHRFRGMVVDHAQDTMLRVMLAIEEGEAEFDKYLPPDGGFVTEEFLASVECIDDPTPTYRWMAAIRAINKDHSRRKGIDTKHFVLQSPPSIDDTGSMAREAGADPQCKVIIDRVVEERQLEPGHIEAVHLACTTETGLATIQSWPGHGKTRVLGAIGEIQVEIGKQIKKRRCGLAVAPSNLAVEQLAESIIGDNSRNMESVWYSGSCLANEEEDGSKGPEGLKAAMRPLWHVVEGATVSAFNSALLGMGFDAKRRAATIRWAATPEHPMTNNAQLYLYLSVTVQPQDASYKPAGH